MKQKLLALLMLILAFISVNAENYTLKNGQMKKLSLLLGVDYSGRSIDKLTTVWQVDNNCLSLTEMGLHNTSPVCWIKANMVGTSKVTCTYQEQIWDTSLLGYKTTPIQSKTWNITIIENESGEYQYYDEEEIEDFTIGFVHPDLHLYIYADKISGEAAIASAANNPEEGNAIIRPQNEFGLVDTNDTTNYWRNIVIPDTIKHEGYTYVITSIGPYAFNKTVEVETVSLPNTIKEICDNAFNWCVNLKSINIPKSVTQINARTFVLCRKLEVIHLPDCITSIGTGAFSDCTGLKEINIPGRCERIGQDAFKWCKSLNKLTIEDSPNTLYCASTTGIGIDYQSLDENKNDMRPHPRGTFGDCSLKDLYLGRNVDFPKEYSTIEKKWITCLPFTKCSGYLGNQYPYYSHTGPSLNSLTFGDNVTIIQDSLFSMRGSGSINTDLILPSNLQYIGKNAFMGILSWNQKELVIPGSVKDIEEFAFAQNYYLEKIVISEGSDIDIKGYAFRNCRRISYLVLSEGVTSIGEYAFNANSIRDLQLPSTLTNIGSYAFNTDSLRKLVCKSLNPPSKKYCAFDNCAIHVPAGAGGIYREQWGGLIIDPADDIVTVNVKTAGSLYSRLLAQDIQISNVFRMKLKGMLNDDDWAVITTMDELYDLDLSGVNLTELPTNIFNSNIKLAHFRFPENLRLIHEEEFMGCRNLSGTLQIPETCRQIGKNAFTKTAIDSLLFLGSTEIGEKAFQNCYRLKYASFAPGSTVGNYAFQYTDMEKATISPNCIVSENAFLNSGLKEVTLKEGVEIGAYAFGKEIEKMVIDTLFKSIDTQFYDSLKIVCVKNLETWCKITFDSNNPMEHAQHLFINGEEPQNITIPHTINRVRENAFLNCKSLTSVIISKGITEIGSCAFSGCSMLTDVSLPNTLQSIRKHAFSHCTSLTTIKLPSKLYDIGKGAFTGCCSIQTVNLPSSVTTIESDVFSGCSNIKSIVFPSAITSIGENAFSGCTSLNEIDLPINILSLGEYAFQNCSQLKKVITHWDNPFSITGTQFSNISSECYLHVPIMSSTKYVKAGWNVIPNLKESGIMNITANDGGQIQYGNDWVLNESKEFLFAPYKSFTLTFTPNEGFYLKKIKLNGNDVLSDLEDNKLFIEEPEENLNISAIFANENIEMGDVNGDGIVNVTDAICVVNFILKQSPSLFYTYAADVNDDDYVNITDVVCIIHQVIDKTKVLKIKNTNSDILDPQ